MLHGKFGGNAGIAARVSVNSQVSIIFNGIFEVQNPAQNVEIFARIGTPAAWNLAVYLACVKHIITPTVIHLLLMVTQRHSAARYLAGRFGQEQLDSSRVSRPKGFGGDGKRARAAAI